VATTTNVAITDTSATASTLCASAASTGTINVTTNLSSAMFKITGLQLFLEAAQAPRSLARQPGRTRSLWRGQRLHNAVSAGANVSGRRYGGIQGVYIPINSHPYSDLGPIPVTELSLMLVL